MNRKMTWKLFWYRVGEFFTLVYILLRFLNEMANTYPNIMADIVMIIQMPNFFIIS